MKTLPVTLRRLQSILRKRFGGVLTHGSHAENGQACAHELVSVARGIPWTDDPDKTRSFDLRPLNDIDVPVTLRTKHLLPVIAAYDGSLDWPVKRQTAVMTRIVIRTITLIIAELPGLPDEVASQCRDATTLPAARVAAVVAADSKTPFTIHFPSEIHWPNCPATSPDHRSRWPQARAAAWAARAAEEAAGAARAAGAAVFETACDIWLEAAS